MRSAVHHSATRAPEPIASAGPRVDPHATHTPFRFFVRDALRFEGNTHHRERRAWSRSDTGLSTPLTKLGDQALAGYSRSDVPKPRDGYLHRHGEHEERRNPQRPDERRAPQDVNCDEDRGAEAH